MALRIYQETESAGTQDKLNATLRLIIDDDKNIKVCAVDAMGKVLDCGNILTFRDNGTIYRHRGVSKSLGFELDVDNMVIANSESY